MIEGSKPTQLVNTLIFYPLFLAANYALQHFVQANAFVLGRDVDHLDPLGLLLFLLMSTASCGAAWLLIQPARLEWRKGPWWPYPLLLAGFVAKGLTLPAGQVAISLTFYLFAVSSMEEIIFRGCMEQGLSSLGPRTAIIVTGLLFGITHAPAAAVAGTPLLTAVLSNLGMGVVGHLLFRWLRNRGGLALPILVHGLMDFLGAGL